MRILIVDTYYPAFLQEFYAQQPGLSSQPYETQWRALMDQCFGTSDFYSSNLSALGHEATEMVVNCEPLQRQWAREHALTLPPSRPRLTPTRRRGFIPWLRRVPDNGWVYPVLRAQIVDYRPDVLYVQDMHDIDADFLREIKPDVRLIVGQIASPVAPGADFSPYDLVLTSFPHFVERFQSQGLASEYFRLGFEPRVLGRLKPEASHPVVFVGGLSSAHPARIALLEKVAARHPIDFWGYGVGLVKRHSPLRNAYHGSAWGLSMYQALFNADITLNQHIDVAENFANNMRLYEATGVGALLITDAKQNLSELFEPGKQIVAYRSPEECVEMVTYYLSHAPERRAIAQAGQARTLTEHSYERRMQELLEILCRQRALS